MILEDRYDGLPFTAEQVDGIGAFLGLTGHVQARAAAFAILGGLMVLTLADEARRTIPSVTAEKRRLSQISSTARKLVNLLNASPSAMLFHATPDRYLQGTDIGGLQRTVDLSRRAIEQNAELLVRLESMAKNAAWLAADDKALRRGNLLPPIADAGKNTVGSTLWPTLFQLWEQAGKLVAETEYGPLHRFVAYVHAAVGLADPSPGTLGDAVKAWKKRDRQTRSDVPTPWETGRSELKN